MTRHLDRGTATGGEAAFRMSLTSKLSRLTTCTLRHPSVMRAVNDDMSDMFTECFTVLRRLETVAKPNHCRMQTPEQTPHRQQGFPFFTGLDLRRSFFMEPELMKLLNHVDGRLQQASRAGADHG